MRAEFLRVRRPHLVHTLQNGPDLRLFALAHRGTTIAKSSHDLSPVFVRVFICRHQASEWSRMDIRFVSSLTSEDERLFAPALLKAVAAILDQLPIAYTVRIETTGADVFQHAHAVEEPAKSETFEQATTNGNGRVASHYLGRVAHS
jgi:hypothetical protein